jgi:hypothetical protein
VETLEEDRTGSLIVDLSGMDTRIRNQEMWICRGDPSARACRLSRPRPRAPRRVELHAVTGGVVVDVHFITYL